MLGTAVGASGQVAGAAGTVASAAGSSTSAAGGLAGVASSTLTSIVGAVASVGSLVTGIISNFQNARQENTLNAIEGNTRYAMKYLETLVKDGIGVKNFQNVVDAVYVNATLTGRAWETLGGIWGSIEGIRSEARMQQPVVVNIQGNVVGNQDFINEITAAIAMQLRLAGA